MTEIFAGSVPLCASYTQSQLHNPCELPFFQTIFFILYKRNEKSDKNYVIDRWHNIQHSSIEDKSGLYSVLTFTFLVNFKFDFAVQS